MNKLPILNLTIFLLLSFFILFLQFTPAYSNTAEQLEQEIEETQEAIEEHESKLESIEARIKEISESNYSVSQKINLLSTEISEIEEEIDKKEKEIDKKLKEIKQKEEILESKRELLASVSDQLYRESRMGSVEFFFSTGRIDSLIQSFFVKSSAISLLKDEITEITGEFEDLTVLKQSLEDEKKELDEQKKGLDDSHDLLIAERNKLQRELNEKYNSRELVSRNIAGLRTKITDLQYHLLLVRQGGTNVDPEAVPSGEDALASIEGFHKYADSGDFGVFAIGAYTHRQGLSQWGAKARAESGQSYKKILSDYYPGSSLGTKSTSGIKIKVKYCDKVNGVTVCNRCVNERIVEYDFETNYMYRLGEMPESWDMEALKAQAIAARTYALNSTNYGEKTIRGDECGQAIAGMKTGRWKEAVDATKGTVMLEDGKVFSSQYAAINGAWVGDAKEKGWWDTTDSSSDWQHKAWDTQSKTGRFGTYYWFYKMWYRTGYAVGSSVSANSCYREPWLSPEELADIVNAAQVLEQTGGDSRIVPIYDACHSAEDYAVSPYSHGELRKIAPKGAKRVNDVITYNSNGRTQNIEFYTDVGEITVSGVSFKLAYNMRAPGHLRIPQGDIRRYDTVYDWVHINIEKN